MIAIFIVEKGFPKGKTLHMSISHLQHTQVFTHQRLTSLNFKVPSFNPFLMAENSSAHISNLFLEDGIQIPSLSFVVYFVYTGFSIALPLLIVGFLFCCCENFINYHIKRCPHCTNPTSTRARCNKSTIGWMMKFCDVIEQFTAWLLVDLFHTPKVEKVLIKEKVCLKVSNQQVQNDICGISWVFLYISYLFCLYIAKFIMDIFLKITPTCISEGDFGFPAICYASLHVSDIHYQINCTTWNENYELLQDVTGLFCASLFYQFLTTLAELVGLYSLQVIIIQITLSILGKISRFKRCGPFFAILTGSIFFIIFIILPINILGIGGGNSKLYLDLMYQQFPALLILYGSFALSFQLLWSTNHNTNPHSRHKGIMPMPNTTHDRQHNRFMKKRKETQTDGETDILFTKGGRNIWHDSKDKRSSETMQREDVMIVEIHDYNTEEACTTREHEKGLLEGY